MPKKTQPGCEQLIPFEDMSFHPDSEKLVQIICERTRNPNPLFFRVHVAYYFSVLASMMRTNIVDSRGKIPVNMYAINLATSGAGKGHSTNIIEDSVIHNFRKIFKEKTLPEMAARNIAKLAHTRAVRQSSDPDEMLERVEKEFENLGEMLFSFDSATLAAIKQARHHLLMADLGSANLQMDELGEHLLGNMETFSAYLELFDVGKIKPKLLKNTAESKRNEEIDGRTPANMMLFGTPSRLFSGDKVEDEFHNMLLAGYARRCFFGFSLSHEASNQITARELLKQRADKSSNDFIDKLAIRLGKLADPANTHRTIPQSEEVSLLFAEYELACERAAKELPVHEEEHRAEMSHRHFKASKLAGTYAFIDASPEITVAHAQYAIKLAEESGQAFVRMMKRDKPYVKLANYVAAVNKNITQVDLLEDLPFYKGSQGQRNEMMQLAIAYGYQNNILIKKSYIDGIEFIRGETLQATNLDEMVISYSKDIAYNYANDVGPFDGLYSATQSKGIHWINHHLEDGHRCEESAIPGFNMVVIDVDDGTSLALAKELLKDYKALYYTTKRHTPENNRFRIVMPTNYVLKLDAPDFKEFMRNLYEWLPFEPDMQTGQRARKWLSHPGHYEYTDGQLLDVLPLIPKTSKNEHRKELLKDQSSMDNLERWVMNNTGDGNRNNQLLRFAMILVDAGFSLDDIRNRVINLNDKLADKLEEKEIYSTIMATVTTHIAKRGASPKVA